MNKVILSLVVAGLLVSGAAFYYQKFGLPFSPEVAMPAGEGEEVSPWNNTYPVFLQSDFAKKLGSKQARVSQEALAAEFGQCVPSCVPSMSKQIEADGLSSAEAEKAGTISCVLLCGCTMKKMGEDLSQAQYEAMSERQKSGSGTAADDALVNEIAGSCMNTLVSWIQSQGTAGKPVSQYQSMIAKSDISTLPIPSVTAESPRPAAKASAPSRDPILGVYADTNYLGGGMMDYMERTFLPGGIVYPGAYLDYGAADYSQDKLPPLPYQRKIGYWTKEGSSIAIDWPDGTSESGSIEQGGTLISTDDYQYKRFMPVSQFTLDGSYSMSYSVASMYGGTAQRMSKTIKFSGGRYETDMVYSGDTDAGVGTNWAGASVAGRGTYSVSGDRITFTDNAGNSHTVRMYVWYTTSREPNVADGIYIEGKGYYMRD